MNENKGDPTILREITVNGFDPDGEPVIELWSDGKLIVHFEAMPPFFAEDNGSESDFEDFDVQMRVALGVDVRQEDREVFVIETPFDDTLEKAKTWLETYRTAGA